MLLNGKGSATQDSSELIGGGWTRALPGSRAKADPCLPRDHRIRPCRHQDRIMALYKHLCTDTICGTLPLTVKLEKMCTPAPSASKCDERESTCLYLCPPQSGCCIFHTSHRKPMSLGTERKRRLAAEGAGEGISMKVFFTTW